jgi:hypothetical protein
MLFDEPLLAAAGAFAETGEDPCRDLRKQSASIRTRGAKPRPDGRSNGSTVPTAKPPA